jgi:hypothetical protein
MNTTMSDIFEVRKLSPDRDVTTYDSLPRLRRQFYTRIRIFNMLVRSMKAMRVIKLLQFYVRFQLM